MPAAFKSRNGGKAELETELYKEEPGKWILG